MVQSTEMNWHYESGGQSLGPVEEEHILSLRAMGLIGAKDRVRREDWPEWREVGEVWPVTLSPHAPHVSQPATGPCVECGAQDPRMISLGEFMVCPACEPLAREKQWQGLPLGTGPWREDQVLVMRGDLALPQHCVKCAQPATTRLKKRLTWHHPALYLAIFPGVLPYLVLALIFRRTLTVDLPLCAACSRQRKRNIAVLLVGFLALVGALSEAFLALKKHEGRSTAWFVVAGVALLFVFLWGWMIQIGMAQRIGDRYARLVKIGEPFLNLLPRWPYD